MESEVGARLAVVRDHYKVNKRQFAIILGIDPSHYVKIESNKVEMNYRLLGLLAREFSINLHWLLTGAGCPGSMKEPANHLVQLS